MAKIKGEKMDLIETTVANIICINDTSSLIIG